ncbi:hypothetical protein PENCOP_c001G01521 [Penicillium coprophilum]|uniref:Uncharacterized protein n=1 Tax=Penicillium coprophilum TaxID=36646 RepID=A0A1V6V5M2_9EURO|nr:hypothetical protein PENCOP_c001G01521 [Penicillium coprophilum]
MYFCQFVALLCLLASASGLAFQSYEGVPHVPRAHPSAAASATRIVKLAAALPTPSDVPYQNSSSIWKTAQCDQNSIDDPTVGFVDRWYAADVPGAWDAMLSEWKRGATGEANNKMYHGLAFPQFVSYFFHGPENWNCKDVGSVPCSSVVQCKDVNHPAGYLILNAFSGIHQLHTEMYNALDTAAILVQQKIGEFTTTFSPQSDNTKMILFIFDMLTTFMGFTVSAFFSIVEKEVVQVASSVASSRGSIASSADSFHTGSGSIASFDTYHTAPFSQTELNNYLKGPTVEFNSRAYANDMTYQLYTITAAWSRNHIPKVHDKLQAQNSVSSALGDIFKGWKDTEASYLETIFSGDDSSLEDLLSLIGDGKMNYLPNTINQNEMAAQLEAVLYGQLLPTAWKLASDDRGAYPRILKTDVSCDTKSAHIPEFSKINTKLMSDDLSVATRACWRYKLVFLLNMRPPQKPVLIPYAPLPDQTVPFSELPSTNRLTFSGEKWGGITFDDIIASAMTGYEGAGYKNGYKSPSAAEIEQDRNASDYGKRVRYPGFFNIPVCEGFAETALVISKGSTGSPFWPCKDPEDYNIQGTTIHVANGWITANGNTPVCSTFKVDDPGYGNTLNATLYGRFDGNNKADSMVKASCKITFSWPKSWIDINYGKDDCMYDGHWNPLNDANGKQVCCEQNDTLTDMVQNPYMSGGECDLQSRG